MKKIVLSILGIFVLAACSEDVYHDIDKQNNGLEVGSDPASEDSGGNAPFTHVPGSPPYDSPWEISKAGNPGTSIPVPYRFENQTGDWGSPFLLTLRATPYLGLAYYDGVDAYDADYFGTTLDPMNYPNLYPATGSSEIGHFIPAFPITLDGTGLPSTGGTVVLEIESSADHCPVLNAMTTTANPLPTIHFDLPGGGSPIPVTPDEEKLLSEYGKVFFYYIEVIDPVTTATVWSGYMMPNAPYTPAYWTGTGVSANIPGVGPAVPLLYNTNSPSVVSQEVILNPTFIPGGLYQSFHGPFSHNGVPIYVEVYTDAGKMYVIIDNL